LRRHLRRVPGVSNTPHLRRQLSEKGWLLYSIWLLQCYLFFRTSPRSCKMLRFLIETILILMVNNIQIMNLLTMMKGRANMETSSYAIVRMKNHIKCSAPNCT
ncbi:unnamed protein product, partial [Musa acuminata var. zebrina]